MNWRLLRESLQILMHIKSCNTLSQVNDTTHYLMQSLIYTMKVKYKMNSNKRTLKFKHIGYWSESYNNASTMCVCSPVEQNMHTRVHVSYVCLELERSGRLSGLFSTSFLCVCHLVEPPYPSALACSTLAYQCWPAPTSGAEALVGAVEASYHVNSNVKHFGTQ